MRAIDDLHSIPPQLLADGYLARAAHGEQLALWSDDGGDTTPASQPPPPESASPTGRHPPRMTLSSRMTPSEWA